MRPFASGHLVYNKNGTSNWEGKIQGGGRGHPGSGGLGLGQLQGP